MSNWFTGFFAAAPTSEAALPEIYRFSLAVNEFIKADILHTYTKILIDTLRRTHGLPEKFEPLLWDNCLQSEANKGLISLIAEAMYNKQDLFLVYVPSVNVLRLADQTESATIRKDYEKSGKSSVGIFVSFKNFRVTDMVKIYSEFEYYVLCGLHKNLNLTKAIQIKIKELRSSVSLTDSTIAVNQAKAIATALGAGKDVLLDQGDEILSATVDIGPAEKSIAFLHAKKAFLLSLPLSYIAGELTPGIGSTGEADMRAVENGLQLYYESIVKPVLLALFGAKTEFKSNDFRQNTSALETLKTFELTSDEYLSAESKQDITARMFDLDAAQEKKRIEAEKKMHEAEQAKLKAERPKNPPTVPQNNGVVPQQSAQAPQA